MEEGILTVATARRMVPHTRTDRMMSEQEITETLQRIGFKGVEVRTVMRDVGQIIAMKVLEAYLQTLPENVRTHIASLQDEQQVQQYLADNKNSFPPFPQSEFDKIHDETWAEYFKEVGRT